MQLRSGRITGDIKTNIITTMRYYLNEFQYDENDGVRIFCPNKADLCIHIFQLIYNNIDFINKKFGIKFNNTILDKCVEFEETLSNISPNELSDYGKEQVRKLNVIIPLLKDKINV